MGSPCQIRLYARDQPTASAAAARLMAETERLEAKYSRYRADSLLTRINSLAGADAALAVDDETAALLDYAATCHSQSGGLFDVTSGVLRACWDFRNFARAPQLPAPEKLAQVLALVGWDKVDWQKPRLALPLSGMEIDFGGIVKEYAADCMATLAATLGIEHGLIELGGDIRIIGPHPDGAAWTLGISNPLAPEQPLATLQLHHGALATSGDYQRCIEIDGKRYHHILHPRTGWPVAGLMAVSVIAANCLIAGSAATIAMLKEDAGTSWLDDLGLPWLGVDRQNCIVGSLAAQGDGVLPGTGGQP
jgi:thiamine biosynthesis lipoprotein